MNFSNLKDQMPLKTTLIIYKHYAIVNYVNNLNDQKYLDVMLLQYMPENISLTSSNKKGHHNCSLLNYKSKRHNSEHYAI